MRYDLPIIYLLVILCMLVSEIYFIDKGIITNAASVVISIACAGAISVIALIVYISAACEDEMLVLR